MDALTRNGAACIGISPGQRLNQSELKKLLQEHTDEVRLPPYHPGPQSSIFTGCTTACTRATSSERSLEQPLGIEKTQTGTVREPTPTPSAGSNPDGCPVPAPPPGPLC